MIYFELFLSFFQIGLFSIGGGYAALPLIKEQIVTNHAWLSIEEFSDIITISQMTPGPIAINASTFAGAQLKGVLGAVVATSGFVLPSLIIVMTLVVLYYKFKKFDVVENVFKWLNPVILALILTACVSIMINAFYGSKEIQSIFSIDIVAFAIFIAGFIIIRKFKLSPILIMLGAALAGVIACPFLHG
jgi:chromate transporter